MANDVLIISLVFSLVVNVGIIGFLVGTGIGKEMFKRFRNKLKYKDGEHVNTLYMSKSGVLKEQFVKKEPEGRFKIDDRSYSVEPRLLMQYKGIPSYIHREGIPEPVNIYSLEYDGISTNELDIIMTGERNFDLVSWLMQNSGLILVGFLGLVGAILANIYFSYSVYETVRDVGVPVAAQTAEIAKSAFLFFGVQGGVKNVL